MKFKQIFTPRRWPSGDGVPVARTVIEPGEFAERFGIRFSRGSDDLDEFEEAGIILDSGRPVLLMRYAAEPPGTNLFVDAADDAAEVRDEFLACFGLTAEAFAWVRGE